MANVTITKINGRIDVDFGDLNYTGFTAFALNLSNIQFAKNLDGQSVAIVGSSFAPIPIYAAMSETPPDFGYALDSIDGVSMTSQSQIYDTLKAL